MASPYSIVLLGNQKVKNQLHLCITVCRLKVVVVRCRLYKLDHDFCRSLNHQNAFDNRTTVASFNRTAPDCLEDILIFMPADLAHKSNVKVTMCLLPKRRKWLSPFATSEFRSAIAEVLGQLSFAVRCIKRNGVHALDKTLMHCSYLEVISTRKGNLEAHSSHPTSPLMATSSVQRVTSSR
ncbi:hypothetical protein GHT06_022419 [Daphnia sinensis]|uniref:Uncharacterized protein n=1 Tax=Daphnia sinensis TaxID=1820382 RepID=A0AAD5KID3_9CRUS|nr:hypothetical protein GHT06_022419 [Daphnia sinensis]